MKKMPEVGDLIKHKIEGIAIVVKKYIYRGVWKYEIVWVQPNKYPVICVFDSNLKDKSWKKLT